MGGAPSPPPQILINQVTLSQREGGGQNSPPPSLRFSDFPTALIDQDVHCIFCPLGQHLLQSKDKMFQDRRNV